MRPVNLLPKEARPAAPRLPIMVGGALVAWLIVLVLATIAVQGRAQDAERANESTRLRIDRLTTQISEFAPVGDSVQEYEQAAALIEALLVRDVSWGGIMTSLSTEIPSRVWLEGFTGSAGDGTEGIGRITMSGVAFDFPDVASWIRSLDAVSFPGVSGAWVQNISHSTVGEADVVVFSSTTALTERALSGRVDTRVPEVR